MYGIEIVEHSGVSQYRQLYEGTRERITDGRLKPKTKLLSTRQISESLKISRSIVLDVVDQLKVEGFLETIHGSGTYVTEGLIIRKGFSMKTLTPEKVDNNPTLISFVAGLPNLDLFPRRKWSSIYRKIVDNCSSRAFSYGDRMGNMELRVALKEYLYRVKGIKTSASNIVITTGASQALSIISSLFKPCKVIMEDPAADFVYDIFKHRGAEVNFVDVDDNGLNPDRLKLKDSKFLYLSPSHQYPIGAVLPAKRRVEIIKEAIEHNTYIVEDDYDGEYRYYSRPIASMFSLAPDSVIYLGTFSKTLIPALRLGYMIVPDSLMERVRNISSHWNYITEGINQMVMAEFISSGDYETHIRKTLKHYKKIREFLISEVERIFGDEVEITGTSTGLHIVLVFRDRVFDNRLKTEMRERGVYISPVNEYCRVSKKHDHKLILGYGQLNEDDISRGLGILRDVISGNVIS